VSVATTASQSVASQQEFDPWGKVRSGGVSQTPRNYTGQLLDATGLLYYNARYYDPAIGRFVSADVVVPGNRVGSMEGVAYKPLTVGFQEHAFLIKLNEESTTGFRFLLDDAQREQLGSTWGPVNAQALNRYTYVFNNPLKYIDPSGHAVPANCWTCRVRIDISNWSRAAIAAAVAACIVLGCNVDIENGLITGPNKSEWLNEQIHSTLSPLATVGSKFAKAGIKVTEHFLHRLAQRVTRGVTEDAALRAYNRGRLYYNPRTRNYVRYDPQTGVAVVVDKPSGGTAITVFEGSPSPDWVLIPWRPGS
jgi:RHS repeat-associated protein